MPDINEDLNAIMKARFGKDVRQSIYNALNVMNQYINDSDFANTLTIYPPVALTGSEDYIYTFEEMEQNTAKTFIVTPAAFSAGQFSDAPSYFLEGTLLQRNFLVMTYGNPSSGGTMQLLFEGRSGRYYERYISSGHKYTEWISNDPSDNVMEFQNNLILTDGDTLYKAEDSDKNTFRNLYVTPAAFSAGQFSDFPEEIRQSGKEEMVTLITIGDTKTIVSTQLLVRYQNMSLYYRYYHNAGSTSDRNYVFTEWASTRDMLPSQNGPIISIRKDSSGDFTSLLEGIEYATQFANAIVYVGPGIWNLEEEFKNKYGVTFFDDYGPSSKRGIYLKNNIHLIFSSNSTVLFEYYGDNQYVNTSFSPFNSDENGFTIENCTIRAKNCRYCFHDERSVAEDQYKNVYVNCSFYLDNSENPNWGSKQCIGGGLGKDGYILIKDCEFESNGISDGYGIVSYHNSKAKDAVSKIVISGCYFYGKGSIRLSWYGDSTKISIMKISNCSLGYDVTERAETSDGTSPNQNTKIIAFNNEIRS